MLRLRFSTLFITLLIGGGITIAVTTPGMPIWAWVLLGLGITYLLATIVYYLTHRVEIDVYRGNLLIGSSDKQLLLAVEGFISSRHPIAVLNLSLCLLGWRIEADDCGLPNQNNVIS